MVIKMKISIIIPIFNRENTIENAIKSVLKQTSSEWELILIDDGSTDRTFEICSSYSTYNNKIFYYYQSHKGVSAARNLGVKKASGDYVLFLDSDNSLKRNAVEVLQLDNKNIDFVTFGFSYSLEKEWVPSTKKMVISMAGPSNPYRRKILGSHLNISEDKEWFLSNFVWNKAFNREFLINNNIQFDEKRIKNEDGIYVINAIDKSKLIMIIPKVIYNAHCKEKIIHLSDTKIIDTVIQYLNDETEFKNRFDQELEFGSNYYCIHNIRIVYNYMRTAIANFGKAANPIIKEALSYEIILYWISHYKPKDIKGSMLKCMLLYISKIQKLLKK